jgi:hypothetical protein
MNAIACTLSITWKEIQLILKDVGSLAIFFLLPVFLIVMMGGVNLQANQAATSILLDVGLVNEDNGSFGRNLARALVKDVDVLKIETFESVAEPRRKWPRAQKKPPSSFPLPSPRTLGTISPLR